MSCILTRLNTLSSVGMYAMTAVAMAAFLTTNFLDMSHHVDFKVNKVMVKNVQEFSTRDSRNDVASLTFDLQFDTDPLWNWNTKQLYMYLVAEYVTERNDLNQVVVWDKIVEKHKLMKLKSKGKLTYKSTKNKYYFFDDGAGLLGHQNVTFYLAYNVIGRASKI